MTCYGVFAATTAIIVIIVICILLYITNNSRYMSPNTMGVVESLSGKFDPNIQDIKYPTGPFASTCSKCKWMNEKGNAWITCDCKKRDGTSNNTTLSGLRGCKKVNGSPQLANINGVLWCPRR